MNKKSGKKSSDISNKMLAAFASLAIIVSLASLFAVQKQDSVSIFNSGIPFTGMAGTNLTIGNVSAIIQSFTYINFTIRSIDFGTGYVTEGSSVCNLTVPASGSPNTAGCTGLSAAGKAAMSIENLGNEDVALNLSFSNSATSLFGSPSSAIWFIVNPSASSCCNNSGGCDKVNDHVSGGAGGLTDRIAWSQITASNENALICHWMNSSTGNLIDIGYQFIVPRDGTTGTKTLTITAYGRTCDGTQGSRVNCTATYDTAIY